MRAALKLPIFASRYHGAKNPDLMVVSSRTRYQIQNLPKAHTQTSDPSHSWVIHLRTDFQESTASTQDKRSRLRLAEKGKVMPTELNLARNKSEQPPAQNLNLRGPVIKDTSPTFCLIKSCAPATHTPIVTMKHKPRGRGCDSQWRQIAARAAALLSSRAASC